MIGNSSQTAAQKREGITRRSFLGGAGIVALGAGTMGSSVLAGCSSQETTDETNASSVSGQASSTSVYAQLNPQDNDYMSNSIEDWTQTTLLSELNIGSVTIRNRMIKSAATSGTTGDATQMVAFYGNIAKGGVGAIFIEGGYKIFDRLDTEEYVATEDTRLSLEESPLQEVVDEIRSYDCPVFIQIKTSGGIPDYQWANLPEGGSEKKASELSEEDIQVFIEDFASASAKFQAMGFDGVELNAAGDNLPGWFLSRMRNDRDADDPYGPGSIENRARFVNEIIAAVKETCGDDFAIQVLVNGVEENDDPVGDSVLASSVEEVALLCEQFEAAGADSIELRLGVFGNHDAQFMNDAYFGGYGLNGTNSFGSFFDFSRHFGGYLDASHSGCGLMLGAAAYVKQHVSIPVGAVTYMDPAHAPDFFEAALNDGVIDFFFMNRPLANADPDYPNKLYENRHEEIRPCCHCLHCALDSNNHLGITEGCRVNPCKGRAFTDAMPEGYDLPEADGEKNIMVVGGGPAGMEAARIAAERGYTVSLYETQSLGGLLDFARSVKGEHENLGQLRDYLVHMLEVDGVSVTEGQEVDADFVREQNPDVVIVATGGVRQDLGIEGSDTTPVIDITDFLNSEFGENVVVAGFNAQALDTAMYLTAQGKKVTMVADEDDDNLGKGQSRGMLSFVLPGFRATGCRIMANSTIKSIGDGQVTISSSIGTETVIDCDAVINAIDMVADTSLADELEDEFDVYAVGDCADPWDIQTAIATGNLAARAC